MSFTIDLDRSNRLYEPGEKVTCKIEVNFDAPTKVRCIAVRFHGFASTEWTKVKSSKGRKRIKTYTAYEEYFRTYNDLAGERGGPEIEFPAGRHIYPVEYVLPFSLPSSFQGIHGGIHYTIKAKLDADGDFNNKSLKEEFYIASALDLNLFPETREQKKDEAAKYFCCWCCRSGPLSLATTIPRSGYLPGEKINFLVECDNTSRIDVLSVKVFLKEIQTFRSTAPKINTKISEELVSEVEYSEGTKSHDSKNFKGELNIPNEKVKNTKNCTLIDVDYEIYVVAEVNKLHIDLENRISISLGSIPFATTPSDVIMAGHRSKAKSGSIPFIDSTD